MADFRINFYQNLSTLLNAGLPILRAVRTTQQQSLKRYRHILQQIEEDIHAGVEMSESIKAFPKLFDPLDSLMIHVGEQTGQMVEILKNLGDWYQLRQRQQQIIRSGLAYPAFIIHFAAFVLPLLPAMFGGGVKAYVHGALTILTIFYIPVVLFLISRKLLPQKGLLRRLLDYIILWIPLLGSAMKFLAIGRYCSIFSVMYKAGIPILQCAALAPQTCGNRAIAHLFEGGYYAAKAGKPMSEGFGRSLPAGFLEMWSIGEESGDLDKASEKLAEIYMDKAQFRLELIAVWMPRLIYFAVMIIMAILIIKAFVQIYSTILSSLGDM
jgi:type IV pilus assembly protein PilC